MVRQAQEEMNPQLHVKRHLPPSLPFRSRHPQHPQCLVRFRRRNHNAHAHAHVVGIEHIVLADAALFRDQVKNRQHPDLRAFDDDIDAW